MRRLLQTFCLVSLAIVAGCQSQGSGDSGDQDSAGSYASSDLVVHGTVVTMDDARRVLIDGAVVITEGVIVAVLENGEPLPEYASGFPVVETSGFIYPGLVNSHNHIAFNSLPPWSLEEFATEPLTSVYEWREEGIAGQNARSSYEKHVLHARDGLVEISLAPEMGKWAELKELAAGSTLTQGSFGFERSPGSDPAAGIRKHLVRNIDLEGSGIRQSSSGIYREGQSELDEELLGDVTDDGDIASFLVHLSEGAGDEAVAELYALNDFQREEEQQCGPLMKVTSAIHGTAYGPEEFSLMAECGASLIVSPLGNLLFYGRPPDIPAAVASGINVALSTDWSVVGSRNLLEEIKVADFIDTALFGDYLDDQTLVEMVTRNAAEAAGWGDYAGRIEAGWYGDLLVLRTSETDPYAALVRATEREVALTVVGGDPLYGDPDLMESLKPGDFEVIESSCGFSKAFDVTTDRAEVEKGTQRLSTIEDRLGRAFRLDRTLRSRKVAPLFTCEDDDHFRMLRDSGILPYYSPELSGLPAALESHFRSR